MNHAAPAAAAAARAAKHAVCAMAKAQQKAKAKIRWAEHKRKQFLESPFYALEVTPAMDQHRCVAERVGMWAEETHSTRAQSDEDRRTNFDAVCEERDELERDLKYKQTKYRLAMNVHFSGRDVAGLMVSLRQLAEQRCTKLQNPVEAVCVVV